MNDIEKKIKGYIYILEVKDINLPVCKIGMTSRNSHERCAEINKSSTGDFIWEVAHQVTVDDCKKLESLVHAKLAPLKQKRREFFNIYAEDAYRALISIIDSQSEIKKIKSEEINGAVEAVSNAHKKKAKHKRTFNRANSEYIELLQSFTSILNVKGRPFGQLNKPSFGMSDGNEGVQWNILVSTDTGIIRLGVNLEGLKYKNWPITTFILSEMNSPTIQEIKSKLKRPEDVYIRFARDAWQVTSRPNIIERYLGGREYSFAEMDPERWMVILNEALNCLNKENDYRGRAEQTVTLENKPKNGEQIRTMEVSPHLTIWSPLSLDGDIMESMRNRFAGLQPIYDWVARASRY